MSQDELVATYPVRCQNHVNADNLSRFNDHLDRLNASATAPVEAQRILSVEVVYVIIPLSTAGNLSVSQVQAQHQTLNKYFYEYHGGLPAGIPHYPYDKSFGNPYIEFAPRLATEVTEASGRIVRLRTPASAPSSGYSDPAQCQAEFEAQGNVVKPGTMYLYLTSLASSGGGTLLGQAGDIISNMAMIHYGTVGSDDVAGAFGQIAGMENYAHGMTMVHEVGHCLGLYHPFSGSPCNSADTQFIHTQTPQTPLQANPNFGGEVFLSNLTRPETGLNAWDNAGRDYLRSLNPGCSTATPPSACGLKNGDNASTAAYSCVKASTLADPKTAWECPFNIMDYADDTTMLGFLEFNCNTMRNVLLNNPQLFNVTQLELANGSLSATPTVVPSTTPTSTVSASFWTTTNIALVTAGCVVGVLLIIFIVVMWRRRALSSSSHEATHVRQMSRHVSTSSYH